MEELSDLVEEALAHPISGWDFSWLDGRLTWAKLPWDYDAMVSRLALSSPDLLDLGTGGGEWLAALPGRPVRTVALEGFDPNLPIARARLEPLGIEVLGYTSPHDNVAQTEDEPPLPFPAGSFHLVVDRHESFVATEIHRVLRPGGRFLTQQVSTFNSIRTLLRAPATASAAPAWGLSMAVGQVGGAGLMVEEALEARTTVHVLDVGALVWYLLAVPWEVPDFTVERYWSRLVSLHQRCRQGPLTFEMESFLVAARRPE